MRNSASENRTGLMMLKGTTALGLAPAAVDPVPIVRRETVRAIGGDRSLVHCHELNQLDKHVSSRKGLLPNVAFLSRFACD